MRERRERECEKKCLFIACAAACVRCVRGGVRSLLAWRRSFVACVAAFFRLFIRLLHTQRHAFVACGCGRRSLRAQQRSFVHLQWQERKIETKKDSVFLPVE